MQTWLPSAPRLFSLLFCAPEPPSAHPNLILSRQGREHYGYPSLVANCLSDLCTSLHFIIYCVVPVSSSQQIEPVSPRPAFLSVLFIYFYIYYLFIFRGKNTGKAAQCKVMQNECTEIIQIDNYTALNTFKKPIRTAVFIYRIKISL